MDWLPCSIEKLSRSLLESVNGAAPHNRISAFLFAQGGIRPPCRRTNFIGPFFDRNLAPNFPVNREQLTRLGVFANGRRLGSVDSPVSSESQTTVVSLFRVPV